MLFAIERKSMAQCGHFLAMRLLVTECAPGIGVIRQDSQLLGDERTEAIGKFSPMTELPCPKGQDLYERSSGNFVVIPKDKRTVMCYE